MVSPGPWSPVPHHGPGMTTLLVVSTRPDYSRDKKTAANSTNFIIHSTPILDKEDQRIVIFPHFAPNLGYFFSVSKSNNMKGNAAETFIKPTIRIRRLNVNLIVY